MFVKGQLPVANRHAGFATGHVAIAKPLQLIANLHEAAAKVYGRYAIVHLQGEKKEEGFATVIVRMAQ